MTYRYIVVAAIIFSTGLAGCKKNWEDTKPNGLISSAYLWTGEENLKKGIAAIYANLGHESTFGRDFFYMQNASDDVITGRPKADADNMKNFIPTGREGYMTVGWGLLYWVIDKANEAIKNVPTATNVSEELKKRSLGEAYFIRAFAHFWLAYSWGHKNQGVPFQGVEDPGYRKELPPQLPSVIDNYARVISDLEKAAELLPFFETYEAADMGRAHKAAAWAYMVKTYAYWAQYDASKWALIPGLCDKIKTEGHRALITGKATLADNYKAVFTIENNWSSEYIWSITGSDAIYAGGSIFPGVVMELYGWNIYTGWGYFQPTEELYEEYEMGDPRREVTILKFGDDFKFFGVNRKYFSTNSRSGFQINKYMEPYGYGTGGEAQTNPRISNNSNGPTTGLSLPLIRYAEILLFKAEALIQQGKNAEAAAPLNELRVRVGLAPVTSPTMNDLKHERRVELACEWTDRLADLKRWGDFDKIRSPLHGRIHTNKTDPASPYTIQEVWPSRNFDPAKHMAWPLNPDEISRSNGVYKQTPGW